MITSVTVVELLQDTNEHEAHVWVDIQMGEQTLTVRVDPCEQGGFNVYMSANGHVGDSRLVQ